MYSRIYEFFEKHNIIAKQQNGFQKEKSIDLAIYQNIFGILKSIEMKEMVVGVYCDLSRAFDCVDHGLLLDKLERCGIRGTVRDWFESYLTDRYHCVSISNVRSDWLKIKRGVPQGSVLGTLLFLVYVNDLPGYIPYNSVMFADDTSIIYKGVDQSSLNKDIASLLRHLDSWFKANSLSLNINKTQAVNFSKLNIDSVGIAPFCIKLSDSIKFLGLTVDKNLSWICHIEQLRNRLVSYAYLIYKLSTMCSQETALAAYYAYVFSILRYGVIFWGGSPHTNQLFFLQKRCLRNIVRIKQRESCKPYFKQLGILTMSCIYILEAACFVKKNYDYFEQERTIHEYCTRAKTDLHIPHVKYSVVKKNMYIQMMKIYNAIPSEIKSLNNKLFKQNLKKYLITNAYYSTEEFFNV